MFGVRISPPNRALDHADRIASARQHELDHTYLDDEDRTAPTT